MEKRPKKALSSPAFSLEVDGVKGLCPAGEKHAKEMIAKGKIPVLSCEGPCIRGEIAWLAANIAAKPAAGQGARESRGSPIAAGASIR